MHYNIVLIKFRLYMICRIHKLHWFLLMLIEQSNNLRQMDIQASGLSLLPGPSSRSRFKIEFSSRLHNHRTIFLDLHRNAVYHTDRYEWNFHPSWDTIVGWVEFNLLQCNSESVLRNLFGVIQHLILSSSGSLNRPVG